MPSGNNILAVIAALLVTAQALPPSIGRGTYTYDPDSIVQSERILRLFLRLASETASRLIRMKNEAKLRQASTFQVNSSEPSFRIQLSDVNPQGRIANKEGLLQSQEQPVSSDGEKPDAGQLEKEPEGPCVPAGRDSQVEKAKDERKEVPNAVPSGTNDREIHATKPEPRVPDDTPDSSNVTTRSASRLENSVNSTDAPVASTESQSKMSESSEITGRNITNDGRTEEPVEIDSRMMINVEKNNYVSHQHSQTISTADRRITSIDVPQMGSGKAECPGCQGTRVDGLVNPENTPGSISFPGSMNPIVLSRNAESRSSSQDAGTSNKQSATVASSGESRSGVMIRQDENLVSGVQGGTTASGIAHQALEPASNLQSGANSTIIETQESSGQNGAAVLGQQTLRTGSSNDQTASKGITSKGVASSGQDQSESARMANQPLSPGSNFQSQSKEIARAFQDSTSSGQSGSEAAGIAHPALIPGSNLQSESKVHGFGGLSSRRHMSNGHAGLVNQVTVPGSNLQPGPAGQSSILSVVQDEGSKLLNGNVPTGNPVNQSIAVNRSDKNLESERPSGPLDPNKLGGPLSSLNPAKILMNQGISSTTVPNQAVMVIANVGNGTLGALMRAARTSGPKVLEEVRDPAMSLIQSVTGQAGKVLGELTDTGSRHAGSLILKKGSGVISNIEIKPDNPSSALMESGGGGISEIGSRLMGSLPFFRSFPNVKAESRRNESAVIGATERIEEHRNAIELQAPQDQASPLNDKNSTKKHEAHAEKSGSKKSEDPSLLLEDELRYENGTEKQLSKLDLHDFANQFADALRPLESGQKLDG